ncbi:hypothetical protein MRX96_041553 [Rhipicephalus microplus]
MLMNNGNAEVHAHRRAPIRYASLDFGKRVYRCYDYRLQKKHRDKDALGAASERVKPVPALAWRRSTAQPLPLPALPVLARRYTVNKIAPRDASKALRLNLAAYLKGRGSDL